MDLPPASSYFGSFGCIGKVLLLAIGLLTHWLLLYARLIGARASIDMRYAVFFDTPVGVTSSAATEGNGRDYVIPNAYITASVSIMLQEVVLVFAVAFFVLMLTKHSSARADRLYSLVIALMLILCVVVEIVAISTVEYKDEKPAQAAHVVAIILTVLQIPLALAGVFMPYEASE
ncbi:hypothetical protein AAVH_27344 [Aphelenchoides avenae]|nr:hypothetical protein AAVH_27344 [Aphelenchus avenae]